MTCEILVLRILNRFGVMRARVVGKLTCGKQNTIEQEGHVR